PVLAVLGVGLAFWCMAAAISELAERIKLGRLPISQSLSRLTGLPRSAIGMTIAHFGLGVCVLGIVGTSAWSDEVIVRIKPGDQFDVAGYTMTFDRLEQIQGPNYVADRGTFTARAGGTGSPITLVSEKRWYPVAATVTTEVGLRNGLLGNLYVNLGSTGTPNEQRELGGAPNSSWSVTAYYHPLISWIWWGSGLMVVAGLVSLSDRRLRLGLTSGLRRQAVAA
ncbi:MAG: cytochrome c-type biogenesis CcmF C-terminal domain-containing protein, partial [Pseudomonadota bacterium]